MNKEIKELYKMYNDTIEKIRTNPEEFKVFLKTASQNFKLQWQEQVLIYAQKPNATAVLEMEKWYKLFNRYVENGENTIFTVRVENQQETVKHYYDISDTKENINSKPVPIWQLNDENIHSVKSSLEKTYGIAEQENLENTIDKIADIFTEKYGDGNADTFKRSVKYMIYSKLNLDVHTINFDFQEINKITDLSSFISKVIGASQTVLVESSKIITQLEKEKLQDRRNYNGNTGLSSFATGREKANNVRKMGSSQTGIPESEGGGRNIFKSELDGVGRVAMATPDEHREESAGNDRTADGTIQTTGRRDGGAETTRPDEMDRNDEQHSITSQRNSISRSDRRLKSENIIEEAEDNKPSAFVIPGEVIDSTICSGSGFSQGKMRIYEQFKKDLSIKENANFLKNEYGVGGSTHAGGFAEYNQDHNAKGLCIKKGYGDNAPKIVLSWNEVAKRINELINLDRYLNAKEQKEYQEWQTEKAQHKTDVPTITCEWSESTAFVDGKTYSVAEFDRIMREADEEYVNNRNKGIEKYGSYEEWLKEDAENYYRYCGYDKTKFTVNMPDGTKYTERQDIGDGFGGVIDFLKQYKSYEDVVPILLKAIETKYEENITNDDKKEIKTHQVGDIVYIGASSYSISKMDDNTVTLVDEAYPLFTKEYDRKAFDETFNFYDNLNEVNSNEIDIEFNTNIQDVEAKNKMIIAENQQETDDNKNNNFSFAGNAIEYVGKKDRFRRNVEAINILKDCELENRNATEKEKIALSKYVGFGGLAEAFDENNQSWKNEFQELYTVLSPEEYKNARASVNTAFYTPTEVISGIFKVLKNCGFERGNILEPSCGIGNFIGMLPETMQDSKVYGVEIDTISAGIAKLLYPNSSIVAQGFEKTDFPDNFFDVVVGNVPFGDFKVFDKRYDKHNFLIHDYFFAKSLDKIRPGGIMALVTSQGTMDKKNPKVRQYIANRAELLGAIRLPNNVFGGNAGAQGVVSDILFLQKRDRILDISPDWVHLGINDDGITLNRYFIDHPEMVLGNIKMVSGRFGETVTCEPFENQTIEELLDKAINNISGKITNYIAEADEEQSETLPADLNVKNYSYTVVDGKIYFRENAIMTLQEVNATAEKRIKGMIKIRDSVKHLIMLQTENYSDEEIKDEQANLNKLYDDYTKQYGLLNSRANSSAFSSDSSYPILSSLEVIDENGNFKCKSDMFYKRTIRPHITVTSVDTSAEALAVSLAEKAKVDIQYMQSLTGFPEAQILKDLRGVLFRNIKCSENQYEIPKATANLENFELVTADEYLSGNVRNKLKMAKAYAEVLEDETQKKEIKLNIQALQSAMPKELNASEISVRLGATWIPKEDVQNFVYEFLETPLYLQYSIKVNFSSFSGEWQIENKNADSTNIKATSVYGTKRINAYKIIEETLNLKDVRIFDYVEDNEGKTKAILNKKETAIACSKQEQIKEAFAEWIFKDPHRRERLCNLYNEKFNSVRPREYDGSHLTFPGINPEISLRPHQVNAIAHILYGGNTLLAHTVGAGKTFEMVSAAMESKRLGLCNKSLFVVPNHLTEQWGAEFLQLYPGANILVATKKDFETKNRKKFCARIATGEYDAVIIGHSQFEKIPLSVERQQHLIESQINEITMFLQDTGNNRNNRFTVKQLEKTKKSLNAKLEKLNSQERKDNVITFEELGVDRLFVDEAHYYKNLYLYTKMRNVGGIAQTEAQKSSDLFMKCQYLDEITNSRGTIFATGTPISNSMVELYTMQRYLQYNTLVENGLQNFDAWASTFGETITATELNPEGTGYRSKTRFAKFYNLPELMSMFKEVADIQTADMLNLPVPEASFHNVAVKPSEIQKKMVEALAERAENVRNSKVEANVDNMLKITNDGRKLALDQRMLNETLPDFEYSKINSAVDNIYNIYENGMENKTTQLVFCDLSTPKNDGSFNVYDDIRNKLGAKGIPKNEIQFIHEANSESKKQKLFEKVRSGEVRILMGSTAKMGAGTNVQDKLIALHDIDCPWRPSDLEQRLGRIVRQGNTNEKVDIYRYVTEQTFDAYLYQLVENKQKFSSQIMTSKSPVRTAEDIDETALSYAEIKMLATGNPYIKEKMDLDIQVAKLRVLKQNYLAEHFNLEDKILKYFPKRISELESVIKGLEVDNQIQQNNPKAVADEWQGIQINNKNYFEKAKAGEALLEVCKQFKSDNPQEIGSYRGFKLLLSFDSFEKVFEVSVKGNISRTVTLGIDEIGNITRLDNAIDNIPEKLKSTKANLENTLNQLENAKVEMTKPFAKEDELKQKTKRLNKLNALLNVDKSTNNNQNKSLELDDEELELGI